MKFDVEKTINYWKDSAEYDLETADALFEKERFPYALFMGHLAIEKLLKGLFVRDNNEHAPWIHSLPVLASKLKIKISDNISEKLGEFMEFHLEGRYPDYQMEFYAKCTQVFTAQKMEEIREIYKWLNSQFYAQ
ncbi:HEPN domain-containing protein [bacterium]|nr:HEPN domain-containing protein [bacterium]MBU1753451.1 HEPN domain-containing protein [bacterium]